MDTQASIEDIARELLSSKGLDLVSCKIIQFLWAGYGNICHITARSNNVQPKSLILKYINPRITETQNAPLSEGHIRKVLSYQVEQYFYTHLAPQMPDDIAVASCIASMASSSQHATAMIMEDLRIKYPVAGGKRAELSKTQIYAALRWLARFHGYWWKRAEELRQTKLCQPPKVHYELRGKVNMDEGGVWLNGGYTYLETRQTEYESLLADQESEWYDYLCLPSNGDRLSRAQMVAQYLSTTADEATAGPSSKFTTLIHGDVKSENLCTSTDGQTVAFFDFQYVGLGLGVCDLAKLFTCSVSMQLFGHDVISQRHATMGEGEATLLRFYIDELEKISGKAYPWADFQRHWETALVDWLRFQASWGFWGNTDWLEARVRSIVEDRQWNQWLRESVQN